jgi:Tfp pilus assembly protein PilN
MIEINLLPGPKKKRGGGGFTMPDFKALASSIKDPLLLGVIGVWIASALFVAFLWTSIGGQERDLIPALEQARADEETYSGLLVEKRRMEDLRDSLVVELEAISLIDEDRYTWPHILAEISQALPDFTWLVAVDNIQVPAPQPAADGTVPSGPVPIRFSIEGRTSDIQAYTRFVRLLGGSPWLHQIEPGATQTVLEEERQVIAFQIQGEFRRADSAFVRTAPVTEVVR